MNLIDTAIRILEARLLKKLVRYVACVDAERTTRASRATTLSHVNERNPERLSFGRN